MGLLNWVKMKVQMLAATTAVMFKKAAVQEAKRNRDGLYRPIPKRFTGKDAWKKRGKRPSK